MHTKPPEMNRVPQEMFKRQTISQHIKTNKNWRHIGAAANNSVTAANVLLCNL
jgi:hypothetical protein